MSRTEVADLMDAAVQDDEEKVAKLVAKLDREGVAEFQRALTVISVALDGREADLDGG